VPNGRVLRTHHYYSKRPYQTFMYGEFDKLKWSAYIGMGNETVGTALSGSMNPPPPLHMPLLGTLSLYADQS